MNSRSTAFTSQAMMRSRPSFKPMAFDFSGGSMATEPNLVDFSLVDVDEGGGALQVLQVDVVDDPGVHDHVVLKNKLIRFWSLLE